MQDEWASNWSIIDIADINTRIPRHHRNLVAFQTPPSGHMTARFCRTRDLAVTDDGQPEWVPELT
jgi:hypothetical protein